MVPSKQYIEDLCNDFLHLITMKSTTAHLARELNSIEKTARDYKERELLELIQNMEDQGKGKSICGLIKIQGDNLIVCNQGQPFSDRGIASIQTSDLSPKTPTDIGNMGLGFRGILNLSDKVQIFSGDYAVEFSEQIAQKYFDAVKDNPQVQMSKQVRDDMQRATYIPMLSVPEPIEYPPERNANGRFDIDGCEYDTYIKIHLKDDETIKNIKKQIDEFISNHNISLLFMRSLKSITLSYDGVSQTCSAHQVACDETAENPNITKWNLTYPVKSNGGYDKSEPYYVCRKDDMAICFPEKINTDRQYDVFLFFPMTKQPCDFPVVFHSEKFKPESNRKSLQEITQNAQIAKKLLDFLLETATFFAKPKYKNLAIDMLKHDKLSKPFCDFKDQFYAKLRTCPIVPTAQSTYKSLNDNLRLRPQEFDDCQNVFEYIDKTVSNDIQQKLPPELRYLIPVFSAHDLYNEINKVSDKFDSDTRALLFYDWKLFHWADDLMPKILRNTNGDFFTYDSENHEKIHITGTDMNIMDIPMWANHDVVDIADKDALYAHVEKLAQCRDYDAIETNKSRVIRRVLDKDFFADDISDLLTSINNRIENKYERAVDFVVFLLKNIKISYRWNEKGINFKFPTANHTVADADTIFFGKSYGNKNTRLCELFGLTEFITLDELKSYIDFDITAQQITELLGEYYYINERPMLSEGMLLSDINSAYKQKLSQILKVNYTYDIKSIIPPQIIPNLEKALGNVKSTEDTICILDWLNNEYHDYLSSDSLITVKYIPNGKRSEYPERILDNYDRFLLYNMPWLKINDGDPYAPRALLLKSGNDNIKSIPGEWLAQYKDLFKLIGVNANIWEMDDNIFYDIMLRLPSFDTDGTISRQIYSNLAGHYDKYNKSTCKQKQDFLAGGWLFAKNSPQSPGEFKRVQDVKFASAKPININKEWLIDKPVRTGDADEFKNIFGIDKFEENINITKIVQHPVQDEFDSLWQEFKPFAEIYATKSTEQLQSGLSKLQITVVSYAEGDNIPLKNLDDYFVIQGLQRTKWYIYLSENNTINRAELSRAIGSIFNVVANSTKDDIKKDIQLLFNAADENARLKVLEEDLGYVVSDYKNHKSVQESFVMALKRARGDDNVCDDSDIESINFSDINSQKSVEQIIHVLQANNLKYDDIKKNGFEKDIDFNQYHTDKIIERLEATERAYKENLYLKLQKAAPEEQQQFFAKLDARKHIAVIENDIDCDYDKYCPPIKSTGVDITAILHENLAKFQEKYPTYSDDVLQDLTQSERAMALFNQIDNLKQSLDKKIQNESENLAKKTTQEQSITYTNDWDDSDVESVKQTDHQKSGSGKSRGTVSGRTLARVRAHNGDHAEQIVYDMLKSDAANSDVDWVSCAGFRAKQGSANDDSLGYDMKYTRNGKTYYVEVKAVSPSGNTCEFFVSDNEYHIAKQLAKHKSYKFALVMPGGKIKWISSKVQSTLQGAVPESHKCAVTFKQ